jgi:hypothetical protein
MADERDGRLPDYVRQIDYQSGKSLWVENYKADIDIFKWLAGLIPLIFVVTVTSLGNVFEESLAHWPQLLFAGWSLLGVAMLTTLYWFNKARLMADELSWQWTVEHFDKESADIANERAHVHSKAASRGRVILYGTFIPALALLAIFVGMNLNKAGN